MQARDVTFSVADPDQDIVGGFPDGPITPPALTWAAPSPASGATGVASGNFVATMLHGTASVTITPSSDKAGTWTPTSRTLTVGAPTGSFTFTPSAGGSHVASLANNAGIAAPAAVGYSAAAAPAAGFTAAPTSGTVPFSVTVTSSATGTGLTYDYDWGDGSSHSTSANPSHAYTVAGSYTLTQTVTDAYGRTASTTRAITANDVAPTLTVGAQITSLSVTSESGSGSRPYAATVLLRPGQVPSGSKITNAAGTEVAAIGATYPDGSAAWAVIAGAASATGTVPVHVATGTAPANLTASAIAAAGLTSVAVAFDGGYGTATITDFSTPERVHWATPTTLCARYRAAAPTPGSTALEIVVDVQVIGGRVLVEIVAENCKMNPASPVKPAAASYSAAVVSVNGSTVATVNGNAAPEGNHAAFRSWYASAWVGGDPGLRVTQAHADLQLHPLLFKCDQASTADLSVYAADAYTPWTAGRQRATNMGGTGDHPSIGPLPKWEAQALQSGDYRAWKATEVSALAVLGFNVNYRDTATGLVPTFAAIGTKAIAAGTWPVQQPGGGSGALEWEVAHSPAAGLMAFVARPSPVFIEIAQKVAVWNGAWSADATPGWTAGMFGYWYQVRGRAWGIRSLAHAAFVTPDAMAWKAGARTSMRQNADYFATWPAEGRYTLNVMCDGSPTGPIDHQGGTAGFQQAVFEHHYFTTEICKLANAQLANAGADQAAVVSVANWAALQPVRYVNEQTNGGWRYVSYDVQLGTVNNLLVAVGSVEPPGNTFADWGDARAAELTGAPATVAGTFYSHGSVPSNYTTGWTSQGAAPADFYPMYFWAALVAAYERGVTGADTALDTVLNNVTNLSTFRGGFGNDPRWGCWPQNYVSTDFGTGANAGTLVGDVWTPGRGGAGATDATLVNAVSWALVPTNRWVTVAGTRMDALDAQIKAAVPTWQEFATWDGYTAANYSGVVPDAARYRFFYGIAGGHGQGSNNGINAFECLRMAWAIECLPSDPTPWPADYRNSVSNGGSYTFYGPAYTEYAAKLGAGTLSAVNDVAYDELPATALRNVIQPTAAHNYHGGVYLPDRNELWFGIRRLWGYSLTTKAYFHRRLANDVLTNDWMDGEGIINVYDETTGDILWWANGSTSFRRGVSFSRNALAWNAAPPHPWYGKSNAVFARVGPNILVFSPPENPNVAYSRTGEYWLFSLTSRSVVASGTVQLEAGLAITEFVNGSWYHDSAAIEWIPDLGVYWTWLAMQGGALGLFAIDPTTTPYTLRRVTTVGAIPALASGGAVGGGPGRKMVYMPAPMRAVTVFDRASRDIHLYRFSAA